MKITAEKVQENLENHIKNDFTPLRDSHAKRTSVHEENNAKFREVLTAFAKREQTDKMHEEKIETLSTSVITISSDLKAIKDSMVKSTATVRWTIGLIIQLLSPVLTIAGAIFILGQYAGK